MSRSNTKQKGSEVTDIADLVTVECFRPVRGGRKHSDEVGVTDFLSVPNTSMRSSTATAWSSDCMVGQYVLEFGSGSAGRVDDVKPGVATSESCGDFGAVDMGSWTSVSRTSIGVAR